MDKLHLLKGKRQKDNNIPLAVEKKQHEMTKHKKEKQNNRMKGDVDCSRWCVETDYTQGGIDRSSSLSQEGRSAPLEHSLPQHESQDIPSSFGRSNGVFQFDPFGHKCCIPSKE